MLLFSEKLKKNHNTISKLCNILTPGC
jgi:hypothetical protein